MDEEILILGDERAGTLAQSVGLAQELGLKYRILDLKYNCLAALPNFIFSQSLVRLADSSKMELVKIDAFPKFIISAGRKSATVALYLKEKSRGKSKVIQIMNPNLDFKKFDLVILPKHDRVSENDFSNVVNTVGALTKVNDLNILREKEKFNSWFESEKKIKIILMLGGSSKKTVFTNESAVNLARISSRVAENMGATLFVLNSRRSGDELSEAFRSNLNCDFRFFDWKDLGDENPYLASLAIADFFIISGDSVSMISECCSTGKSVYVFDEAEISTAKHRRFHQDLFSEKYARKLDFKAVELEGFFGKNLRETRRVSELIKKKF